MRHRLDDVPTWCSLPALALAVTFFPGCRAITLGLDTYNAAEAVYPMGRNTGVFDWFAPDDPGIHPVASGGIWWKEGATRASMDSALDDATMAMEREHADRLAGAGSSHRKMRLERYVEGEMRDRGWEWVPGYDYR